MNIDFYVTESGKCPVEEFIKSLEPKMYAKVLRTIDLLETNGMDLREPYSKAIGNTAVLTNGFVKKRNTHRPEK